jgi:hypothetical protein
MSNRIFVVTLLAVATIGAIGYVSGAFAFAGNRMMGNGQGLGQNNPAQSQNFDNSQCGRGQGGQGCKMNAERGQNKGGNFVDANYDGICDHMQQK